MKGRLWIFLGMLWMAAALSGCSTRAWYEGLQEQQRQDCYKYENREDVERCLERVGGASYDEYERERKGMD